jgi:hypothetical protein
MYETSRRKIANIPFLHRFLPLSCRPGTASFSGCTAKMPFVPIVVALTDQSVPLKNR